MLDSEQTASVVFDIPAPPSTNHLYANVPGKGRVKTAAYKAWIREAGWEMKRQLVAAGCLPAFKRFILELRVRDGIDLDNIKAVPDLLKTMGLVVDDRHMVELHVYRHSEDHCTVKLTPA